jgi:tetratricopeptide (TPR) repeat protein
MGFLPAAKVEEIEPSGESMGQIASLPFVGRERERQELIQTLQDAIAGRGRLLLISGEAGVGKTRLCDEVAAVARAGGVRVAWGPCWEAGGARPYWPWVQIIRSCTNKDNQIADDGRYLAAIVRGIFGETASGAEAVPNKVQPPPAEPAEAQAERFQLFDHLARFIKDIAVQVPLLVIIDDLHVADLESVLLTRFLARGIRDARIVVLVTYRESEVRLSPTMAPLVGDLAREGTSFALRGLAEEEIRKFVELSEHKKPEETLVRALYRTTDGNPFFLTEIMRLLAAEGRLSSAWPGPRETLVVPSTIRSAILRRLEPLSETARQVLRVASLVGREFDAALLEGPCKVTGEQLMALTAEAIKLELLSEVAAFPSRFRFSHFLVTDTLKEEISSGERKRFHLEIADSLAARHAENGDEDHLAEIAQHYFEALPIAPASTAVEYTRRAAAHAMSSLAHEEAARLYTRALKAADLMTTRNQVLRCELLLELGEAQCLALEYELVKQTFTEAAAAARATKRPDYLARAALGCAMLGFDATDPNIVAILKEALAVSGDHASALRGALLSRLAEEIRWTAPHKETNALVNEAVSIARQIDDPARLGEALFIKYMVLRDAPDGGPAAVEERLALITEVANIAETNGLRRLLLRAHYNRGEVLLELNEAPQIYAVIETIRCIPDPLRLGTQGMSYREIVDVIDAMRALMEGRIADGESLASRALPVGSRRPDDIANQTFLAQIFLARREQGRLSELDGLLTTLAAQHPELPIVRCGCACCHAEDGNLALARAEFDSLAADDFAQVRRDHQWLACMGYLVETCAALNDSLRAESLYRKLLPYSSRNVAIAFLCYLGPVSYYLGLLASTMKSFDDATRHFDEALNAAGKISARPWVARIQYHYAQTLLSHDGPDNRKKAQHLLSQALATTEALSLQSLSALLLKLQEQLGSPEQAPTEGPILRREGEYWTVIAGAEPFRLKHRKGLAYLDHLMRNPGSAVHVLDLIAACDSSDSADVSKPNSNHLNQLSESQLDELGLRSDYPGDSGEMLDSKAKNAYQSRLSELREHLDEAKELNQPERAEQLEDEIEALTKELARAIGLGGRDRRAGASSERARLSVRRAIQAAVDGIAEHDRRLGHLLATATKTGTFCEFSPDKQFWNSLSSSSLRK